MTLDNIDQAIAASPLLAFSLVFFGGILSSASPCVLATVPLVIGFTGGYAEGNKIKSFLFSLSFITGLSITFTAFGAAAALFGTMFGTTGGWWHFTIGLVAIAMGLQMAGLFELHLPIANGLRPQKKGLLGALFLGMFFGIASSPCATPVLVVILSFAATKSNIVYGSLLLFTYAVGHCLLILAAGTFTGFVEAFVKARGLADFSNWAKKISGAILTLVGLFFIWRAF